LLLAPGIPGSVLGPGIARSVLGLGLGIFYSVLGPGVPDSVLGLGIARSGLGLGLGVFGSEILELFLELVFFPNNLVQEIPSKWNWNIFSSFASRKFFNYLLFYFI
jgi:hypothetical protein